MGIYVETIERQNGRNSFELTMEEAIKAAEVEKQKNDDLHLAYVAAKIRKVESELRTAGIQYDPAQLWGKYIALREA